MAAIPHDGRETEFSGRDPRQRFSFFVLQRGDQQLLSRVAISYSIPRGRMVNTGLAILVLPPGDGNPTKSISKQPGSRSAPKDGSINPERRGNLLACGPPNLGDRTNIGGNCSAHSRLFGLCPARSRKC